MQDDAQVEQAAMQRALDAATTPGLPFGPNPRVGCVVLDVDRAIVGVGHHRGAGTPHAEVDALAQAGERARGGTALVTLEPCTHTGRTGPCADALLAAGVRRVVVGMRDPNPVAAGGVDVLRAAGIEVDVLDEHLALARAVALANRGWVHGLTHGRPFVTWKTAGTIDGRAAAADGTSRWITGGPARADVHALRARVDTVLVGTGTVLTDDPALTVRSADGTPAPVQPLRAVMGERPIPARSRLRTDGAAETLHLPTRDPRTALATLFDQGRREVLLEGGPTLAASFLAAGLVDEVVAYVAPVLLGAGTSVLGDLGITSIDEALRLHLADVTRVGDDVRLVLHPPPTAPPEE